MTLAELRQFVRDHLDLDSTELPDSVVDVFIREGFRRIVRAAKRWPFYEKSYSLSTTASDGDYPFSTIGSDLEEIVSVIGPNYELEWVDYRIGEGTFTTSTTDSGEPYWYSTWSDTLKLWPTPNGTYALTVRGYREPTDWVAAGAGEQPDCPRDFDEVIAFWAVHRAYAQQDDPESAAFYKQTFEESLGELKRRFLAAQPAGRVIMNGGRRISNSLPSRLRYPFNQE